MGIKKFYFGVASDKIYRKIDTDCREIGNIYT